MDNESTWNYLNGWFKAFEFDQLLTVNKDVQRTNIEFDINEFPEITNFTEQL